MRRVALAIALAVLGCKRPEKHAPKRVTGVGDSWGGATTDAGGAAPAPDDDDAVRAGSLLRDEFVVTYVVVLPSPPTAAQHGAVVAAARDAGFVVDGDAPDRWITVRDTSREDAVPDLDRMTDWVMPAGDEARLRAATGAIVLGAGGAIADLDATHAALVGVLRDAARDGHGWVVDDQNEAAYDATGIAAIAAQGRDATALTQVFRDPEGPDGTVVLLTGGMARFGLPDLRVRHVPGGLTEEVALVVDASSQTLLDHGGLAADGLLVVDLATLPAFAESATWANDHQGTGTFLWRATWAADDEDVIDLAPIGPGESTARLGIALDACFGVAGMGSMEFDLDTPEVRAATARAQAELRALTGRFARGVPDGESLAVFAPFDTSKGDQYWLWVEVTRARADQLRATVIDSPPADVSVVLGDQVELSIADAIDYKHTGADGTVVGPIQPFNVE